MTEEEKAAAAAADKALAEQAEKEAAAAAEAAKKANDNDLSAAKKLGVEIGKTYRFRAVHGDIVHPYQDFTRIGTDSSKKLVVDSWVLVQMVAGKIVLDTD